MYEEMLNKTSEQLKDLMAPAKKFNALVLDNLEKLASFQLEAAKSYTDLSLEQIRSALEINDTKSLQDYVSQQSKVAETVGKKIQDDANTLASLGKDFGAEVQKLTQENVTYLSQVAQQAAPKKAPARKAS